MKELGLNCICPEESNLWDGEELHTNNHRLRGRAKGIDSDYFNHSHDQGMCQDMQVSHTVFQLIHTCAGVSFRIKSLLAYNFQEAKTFTLSPPCCNDV